MAQKKRNMLNRTQVCNLKIWIEETLSLSKARRVITENILLLKYQKQIIAALNSQYNQISKTILLCCYLMPRENRGYTKCCLLLSVGAFHRSSVDHEFFSRLEIWNCTSVWSADKFIWELMLLCKTESSLEKRKQFHWRIFFQTSRNSVYKRVCKAKVVIQNSAIKCYHEFYVRSNKDS